MGFLLFGRGVFPLQPIWTDDQLGLKQLELLPCWFSFFRLQARKNLHLAELLVGDAQNANFAMLGQKRFHALDVHIGILATRTMPDVSRKLEHGETVAHDALAKLGCRFPLLLGLGRQVVKHHHPHDFVFAESVGVHSSMMG